MRPWLGKHAGDRDDWFIKKLFADLSYEELLQLVTGFTVTAEADDVVRWELRGNLPEELSVEWKLGGR